MTTASTEHSKQDDITVELTKDHNELREMFGKLRAGAAGDERTELVHEMTTELVKHSVAEEVHLYPLIRKILPDGDALADKELEEHAEVEQALKELEKLDPSDSKYGQLIDNVIHDVTEHAGEEEDVIFPQLREKCSSDELHELGDKVRRVKSIAPTHPHPSAPDTPPGNVIMGPMAGLVDRVRDAMAKR
jgi:hemerythrin superfamily protein